MTQLSAEITVTSDDPCLMKISGANFIAKNRFLIEDIASASIALRVFLPVIRMAPIKHSSGTTPPALKPPRLPTRYEEDGETDESEISYRPLTPLPAHTRSSQSTTATQITRKCLLRSSKTPTERSSPWRVEFQLSEDHIDNFEAQEEPETIEAPKVEEIVDTSYSDYDDALENDHESSEEDEDEPEDEPQAPPPNLPPRGLRLSERDLIQFNQPLPEHWAMLGGNQLSR
jgi:hypothetical protein